jgi:hypothetical protein
MATSGTQPLAGDELARLLELVDEADSVELKLTVADSHRRSTVAALDIDPVDVQMRQVFFFDTPALDLERPGVVVRARRVQGKGDDSVVKLRPVIPHDLPKGVRQLAGFVVEVDAMPGGYMCSASLKASLGHPGVKETGRPIRKLFTKDQRRFFAEHADGVELDDLSVLGPITVMKLKFSTQDFDRRLVAELWWYPDASRILELSTRCGTTEPFQVAAEAKAFLGGRGIDIEGEQHTKTRTALEFFAHELAHQG